MYLIVCLSLLVGCLLIVLLCSDVLHVWFWVTVCLMLSLWCDCGLLYVLLIQLLGFCLLVWFDG